MVRNLQRWIVLLCWCSLAAAAAPPGVRLDVPFVKQERNGCGAASIAMVMQYWQRQQGNAPVSASDAVGIQRALYSREARGIFASSVKDYLEEHGFDVVAEAARRYLVDRRRERRRRRRAAHGVRHDEPH